MVLSKHPKLSNHHLCSVPLKSRGLVALLTVPHRILQAPFNDRPRIVLRSTVVTSEPTTSATVMPASNQREISKANHTTLGIGIRYPCRMILNDHGRINSTLLGQRDPVLHLVRNRIPSCKSSSQYFTEVKILQQCNTYNRSTLPVIEYFWYIVLLCGMVYILIITDIQL